MVIEIQHYPFEFLLLHAPVHDADARLGQQLLQLLGGLFDGPDFIVQKVNLATTLELALATLDDRVRVPA